MDETWAIVAHKNGRLGGIISPECGKREVAKFCGEMGANGYTITPLPTEREYLAFIKPLTMPPDAAEQESLVFVEPDWP